MLIEVYEERLPKDCPICGEEAFVAEIQEFWQVECLNSDCALAGPKKDDRDLAVEYWNRIHFESFSEQVFIIARDLFGKIGTYFRG